MLLAIVVRMPGAALLMWSLMLCGPSAPHTVTVLVSVAKPRSTCNGSQGFSSSFSATQKLYLAGWPWVERSSIPGVPPPTFSKVRRIARPMVAFGRQP